MTRFIETHRERFGVEPICRELQVAPSTYYAARQRPRSARRIRDEALQVKLRQVHAEHFGVYGARKLWRQLTRGPALDSPPAPSSAAPEAGHRACGVGGHAQRQPCH